MLCRIVTKIKIWHIFFAESSCCHKMEFFKNSLRNALTVKKKTKNARDIILHKCNINHNHMIYGSWDIKCNRQIFFVILGHILTFYPPNSPKKMKISKKWKHLEISSFYISVPKPMIICYTALEIWCVTDVIVVFCFGQFFALLPP